jgi:hypothetical protein
MGGRSGRARVAHGSVRVSWPMARLCARVRADAALCTTVFAEVLERVGAVVVLKTEYIAGVGRAGAATCKRACAPYPPGARHGSQGRGPTGGADGDGECEGNRYQLCARQLAPDPNVWFNFVVCQGACAFVRAGAYVCMCVCGGGGGGGRGKTGGEREGFGGRLEA